VNKPCLSGRAFSLKFGQTWRFQMVERSLSNSLEKIDMATKTIGTILLVIICILMLPVALGLLGGVFGIVFGVFGAVFGAIFGLIGGIFGAIFGVFGWIFDGLFGWHDYHFFDFNIFTIGALVLLVLVLSRKKQR
jgi:hypothetical protein